MEIVEQTRIKACLNEANMLASIEHQVEDVDLSLKFSSNILQYCWANDVTQC